MTACQKEKKTVNRNFKDSVFRMLFRDKQNLLSLFNAINGTNYQNPEDLEINTLENAIYMTIKNDISCVLDLQMHLYEHQTTINPNMPLRDLFYVTTLFEKIIREQDIYGRKLILLPTPKFIVLYQGTEKQPERKEMRLSDSFMTDTGEINLELVVLQININKSMNPEIKQCCKTLYEYTQYVDRVREHSKKMSLENAVEQAITECIEENILRDFLYKNRAEVMRMSIFEYNEELHRKSLLEEGREEGREEGIKLGEQKGISKIISHMLEKNQSPEIISELTGEPLNYVYEIQERHAQIVREKSSYKK